MINSDQTPEPDDAAPATGDSLELAPTAYAAMRDTLGELVDAVAEVERMIASATAWRTHLIDNARQCSEATERLIGSDGATATSWTVAERARRVVVSELACALRLPERTVQSLLADSQALVHELPETLAALRAGEVSYRHAQKVADHAMSLPQEARPEFEHAIIPFAKTHTVAKLDHKARVLREHTHPESIAQRHVAAAADRCVTMQAVRDGMSWLSVFLPAVDAIAIHSRLTDAALALRSHDDDDDRTLDQLRTDVLTDTLIDGATASGAGLGIRAQVSITVPVLTLLGHSDEPGMLDGHGPIDAETARRLAGTATSFTRILTHPETGAVLSVGKEQYPVPADLRRWLRVRDRTCRFPGCNRSTARCEIDHTFDRQYGGDTAHDNLAHLCKGHHRLKHETEWRVHQTGNGTLEWISPSRHRYTTKPITDMGGDRAN